MLFAELIMMKIFVKFVEDLNLKTVNNVKMGTTLIPKLINVYPVLMDVLYVEVMILVLFAKKEHLKLL